MKKSLDSKLPKIPFALRCVLCLGLITFVVLGAFFLVPANVYYHVTERYVFSGGGEDADIYLGVILPKTGPYQWVGEVEILWDGSQRKEKFDFVDVIKLSGKMSSQKKLGATIEYDVKLPQGYVSWDAPVESFQRLPQTGIESDCECIKEQASLLCNGVSENDVYRTYAFTADYLTYSQDETDCICSNASALKAYESGSCMCLGYAMLMTAFCRASKIPAQVIIGQIYPDPILRTKEISFPQNPCEAHAWVEYYSDGSWKMADPTFGASLSKFMQFNRNDGRHLSYGEMDHAISVKRGLVNWALDQTEQVIGDTNCIRYVATSTSNQVSLVPTISIRRVWDGRWLNMLILWGLSIWLLSKYREKIIGSPRQKTKLPDNV